MEIKKYKPSDRLITPQGDTLILTRDGNNVKLTASRGALEISDVTLDEVDYLDFDVSAGSPTYQEGRIFYDNTNKCIAFYNDEAEVTLQIGQEDWARVYNNTGSTITNGSVVYISGSQNSFPSIALSKADASATTKVLGIATHDIETGTYGYVTTRGMVGGLDTSSYSAGDEIYLSAATAGAFTKTEPTAPNYSIKVGDVVIADASNGKIYVNSNRVRTEFENTVTVSASGGGDYTTIQGAIDSITDASSDNKYIVLIYSGTYNEKITGKNYVSLAGIGTRENVIVSSATGSIYTAPDYAGDVSSVSFQLSPTTDNQKIIYIPSSKSDSIMFDNCKFTVSSLTNDIVATILDGDGGNISFRGNKIIYTMTGNQGSSVKTHNIFDISGSAYFGMNQNSCSISIADEDDNVNIILDASTYSDTIKQNNRFIINNTSASYSGTTTFLNYTGSGIAHLLATQLRMTSAGNGIGIAVKANSTGSTVHTTGNHFHIDGYANNYAFNPAQVGDSITSTADDAHGADKYTGSGTLNNASSFSDGEFDINNKLIVGDSITNYLEIDNAGSITLYGTAKFITEQVIDIVSCQGGTSPARAGSLGNFYTLDFSNSSTESIKHSFDIPADIDNTVNPTLVLHFAPKDNQTSGSGVVWTLDCRYVADGESINKSLDETGISSGTVTVSNTQYISTEATITLDGSKIAADDHFSFQLYRDHDADGDDRNGDMLLFAITFKYTTDKIGGIA